MKVIRLRELDRDTPFCASFDDEEAVRRYETEVRTYRAYTEPYRVRLLDGRVDGAYQVESLSGASYLVDIVDGSSLHDACTCPDFFTSGLGTCKHVEAVRRAIAGNRERRQKLAQLEAWPALPVLAVDASGRAPSLRAWGPWHRRPSLRRLGVVVDPHDGAIELPPDLDLASLAPIVRVTHAAAICRAMLRQQDAHQARAARVQRAIARRPVDPLAQPLFAYQRKGVEHLLRRGRALLADDMGLGKTVQALGACETLFTLGEARSALIVCPASLKAQWASEIKRYTGKEALVVSGASSQRRHQLRSDAPYKVLNYEVTWRELDLLRELDADILVLDEAQRAKNFRTKTAATLRQIPSRFLFVLTGTPVENRLDDLYSLMQLVDPRLLGPLWRFNLEFHEQSRTGKILAYKNLGGLRERIAPLVLRRRKEEVLTQLPPITFQTRYTALSPEQARLEEEHRTTAARLAAQAERHPLTREQTERLLAALLKARQACDAAELCDPKTAQPGSPKLDEFEGLVAEICEQGTAKILVFSEWVGMLKLAAQRLQKLGIEYALLHGGIPTERRPALLDAFRSNPATRVLLSSDAGGTGLNLQVASYIVHLDLPWNPARLDQRTARAHRLGQTRGVTVIHLCAEAGIERGIEGTLATKRSVRAATLELDSDVDSITAPSFSVFLGELRRTLERVEAAPSSAPPSDLAASPTDLAPADHDDAPLPSLPPELALATEPEALPEAQLPSTSTAPPSQDPTVAPEPELAEATEAGVLGAPPDPMEVPDAAFAPDPAPDQVPGSSAASPPSLPASAGASARAGLGRPPHERLRLARVLLHEGFPAEAVQAAYEALAAALLDRSDAAHGLRPLLRHHGALVALLYRELLPSGRVPKPVTSALARLHDLTALADHDVEPDAETTHEALAEAQAWIERLTTPPAEPPAQSA